MNTVELEAARFPISSTLQENLEEKKTCEVCSEHRQKIQKQKE